MLTAMGECAADFDAQMSRVRVRELAVCADFAARMSRVWAQAGATPLGTETMMAQAELVAAHLRRTVGGR